MNIVVCIKQVPGTNIVDIDPETGVLKRTGVQSKMNPYDLYAIETALELKQKHGGSITAITMGPPQAESIIREAFMMGTDEGVLLSDEKFAGADVLATSYTLSSGIKALSGFDLIICGKQTTDGDTSQVGPAIAEHLNIPHVTWVSKIDETDEHSITAEQNMADSLETVRLSFPCLITVDGGINTPRLPSYLNMLKSQDWQIKTLCLDDLKDAEQSCCGLTGSPTQVERIFTPSKDVEQVFWHQKDTDCSAALFGMLTEQKFIGGN